MRFRVCSGFFDWSVVVYAPNEHMAIVKGKQEMIERLQEDDMYAVEVKPIKPPSDSGNPS